MPITRLDRETALVVVDLQHATLSNPMAHPVDVVLANAARLTSAFREHRLPVVLVHATGTPGGMSDRGGGAPTLWPEAATALAPELGSHPDDLQVAKSAWSAFTGTDLHDRLGALGVTRVVVVGVATSFGIESTARAAYDLGYHVVLVVDAMTDVAMDAHDHAVAWTFPIIGQTGTTADVLALLGDVAG